MAIDHKVTEAIADGRVPKDITAAFLNETKDASAIAGIIFVTVLTSIIVLGRLGSRAFLIRRFGVDDTLTLMSWISRHCPRGDRKPTSQAAYALRMITDLLLYDTRLSTFPSSVSAFGLSTWDLADIWRISSMS